MTCVERIVPVSVTVPHGPHHISQVSSIRVDRATGLESVSNVQTDKEKAPTAENIVAAWIMSQETSPHLDVFLGGVRLGRYTQGTWLLTEAGAWHQLGC